MAENVEQFRMEHELHHVVTSFASTKKKTAAFDKWAPTYDEDLLKEGNPLWDVVSCKMLDLIKCNRKAGVVPVVVDAGCGTGAPARKLRELADKESLPIRLIGYDLSPGMLEEARKKQVFDELHVGDFFEQSAVPNGSADFVLCSGVFLEGHCGPEALLPVLDHLRVGGLALISIRINSFEHKKDEYYKFIEQANCVVSELFVEKYFPTTKGMYVVVKKQ